MYALLASRWEVLHLVLDSTVQMLVIATFQLCMSQRLHPWYTPFSASSEPRVYLESRASPLLVPPGYDATLGICSAHWAMPVRVRPVFPASLQAILGLGGRECCNRRRMLGRPERCAEHKLVGVGAKGRLPSCVGIVNNPLFPATLRNHTARDQAVGPAPEPTQQVWVLQRGVQNPASASF